MSASNLLLNKHNPDVLTCIANLSNDEVFTPPEMAAAMLDLATEAWARDHEGENLWANPNARVLDPFVKTGVFLAGGDPPIQRWAGLPDSRSSGAG